MIVASLPEVIEDPRAIADGDTVRDCPGDLMFIKNNDKAAITDNRECWDCAACVKVCPTQAIHMQLPTSLVVRGVTLKGRALKHKTTWSIRLRNGAIIVNAAKQRHRGI